VYDSLNAIDVEWDFAMGNLADELEAEAIKRGS